MLWNRSGTGMQSQHRSRRGGALVELAVAIPLLVFICIGVMDYGRVYFTSVAVTNAARAGAEWGSTPIAGYAFLTSKQESFAQLDGQEVGAITVTASTVCRCGTSTVACGAGTICGGYGEPMVFVSVTASKTVALLLPYPGLQSPVTISRTATFRAQ